MEISNKLAWKNNIVRGYNQSLNSPISRYHIKRLIRIVLQENTIIHNDIERRISGALHTITRIAHFTEFLDTTITQDAFTLFKLTAQ